MFCKNNTITLLLKSTSSWTEENNLFPYKTHIKHLQPYQISYILKIKSECHSERVKHSFGCRNPVTLNKEWHGFHSFGSGVHSFIFRV